MSKNKFLIALYIAVLVAISVSESFWLFGAIVAFSFFLLGRGRKKVILFRSFFAVALFSGFTLLASVASLIFLGADFDATHIFVLFCRSFTGVFLTLSIIDRIGIVNLFLFKNELSIFFVMLFSKIESLKKEMNDFREAAKSRGLHIGSTKESIGLLSIEPSE